MRHRSCSPSGLANQVVEPTGQQTPLVERSSQFEGVYNARGVGNYKLCFTNHGHTHARVNLLVQDYYSWVRKEGAPMKSGE